MKRIVRFEINLFMPSKQYCEFVKENTMAWNVCKTQNLHNILKDYLVIRIVLAKIDFTLWTYSLNLYEHIYNI